MTEQDWNDTKETALPVGKTIDVLHKFFGEIRGCVYYPEQKPHPLIQDCVRFSLRNVMHWRYSKQSRRYR